jgi:hypothetical protein
VDSGVLFIAATFGMELTLAICILLSILAGRGQKMRATDEPPVTLGKYNHTVMRAPR